MRTIFSTVTANGKKKENRPLFLLTYCRKNNGVNTLSVSVVYWMHVIISYSTAQSRLLPIC